MIKETESLHSAQQLLCTTAMNQLTSALNSFQLLQRIDGREPRGRQRLAEELMTIEDQLAAVRNQINFIRNLYQEV